MPSLKFVLRPVIFFVFVLLTYFHLADPIRLAEAHLLGFVGPFLNGDIQGRGDGATVLVHTASTLFAAEVFRGCSSAVALSVLFGIGLLFMHGPTLQRLRGAFYAACS